MIYQDLVIETDIYPVTLFTSGSGLSFGSVIFEGEDIFPSTSRKIGSGRDPTMLVCDDFTVRIDVVFHRTGTQDIQSVVSFTSLGR